MVRDTPSFFLRLGQVALVDMMQSVHNRAYSIREATSFDFVVAVFFDPVFYFVLVAAHEVFEGRLAASVLHVSWDIEIFVPATLLSVTNLFRHLLQVPVVLLGELV